MKLRRLALWLLAALSVLVVTAACSGGGGTNAGGGGGGGGGATFVTGNPDTVNTGTAKPGGSITYVLESNILDWNPWGSDITSNTQIVDDAFDPSVFTTAPDLTSILMNKDLLTSASVISQNPQVIQYKISPKAVWSDGTPITAADFIYTWQSSDPKLCPTCASASTIQYGNVASVVGSDNGKTVTVTLTKPDSEWQYLFSPILPAHIAKTLGDNGTPAGLAKSFNVGFRYQTGFPNWSGGPFIMKSWTSGVDAVLVPNPKWYGTPTTLKQLNFRVITDLSAELPALQNNEVQVITPTPEVDLLNDVKSTQGISYQLVLGLRKQYLEPNAKRPGLADPVVRQALFTAINVPEIISKTVGQFDPAVKPLQNRFYVPGQPGYQDNMGDLGSGNIAKAMSILSAAHYKIVNGKLYNAKGAPIPTLVLRYLVGNQTLATEGALVAASAAQIGIKIDVETTSSIGETVTHQPGYDYDIYAGPFVGSSFLASQNQKFYSSTGALNFGGYSNPLVDADLNAAVTATDPSKVPQDLNAADQQLTKDAWVLPLYQDPELVAYQSDIVNLRGNGTYFGVPYNVGLWGLK
jgi:peptide/nickel transport system substrate-binding protein